MSHSAENINATMLADDDMDDADVLAPIGAAGAHPHGRRARRRAA